MEKFLFVYGIIVATAIGIGSLFFSPRPENFVGLILFLPVIAYFWLRLTSPADVSSSKWSLRLILVVFILTTFGIFGFSLNKKAADERKAKEAAQVQSETLAKLEELKNELVALSQKDTTGEEIASDVARIKEELSQLKEKDSLNTNLLGAYASLEDIPIGQITITNSKTTKLDVLADKSFSASAVGEIIYGTTYQYYQKDGLWYLVKLSDETKGWVNARDVKEVSPTPTP
ncbi:hypothetical protein A2V61_04065 [Candidatus Woesebacteria bacterium RBG_19FT_COMBO_47_8]|nr:MAG: hypothetical protein A2V61_04065 [Candidatus Woesebacteria bacterium RBG_19FT_COMBO_47_8]